METAQYFCTAGRGTEVFVRKELCHSDIIEQTDGKIFFRSHCDCHSLLKLKTVERLFILVARTKECKWLFTNKFRGLRELLDGMTNFQQLISLWSRFQKVQCIKTGSKNDSSCEQLMASLVNDKEASISNNEYQGRTVNTEQNSKRRSMTDDVSTRPVKAARLSSVSQVDDISFRVSCKCSGVATSKITPEEVSRFVGGYMCQRLGWTIDLRHPKLEIYMNISDCGLVIGIPVTKEPLSKRSYLKHIGLRSTIAFIMAQAADIMDYDVVLDPLCGTATILVEAAVNFRHSKMIGCDISNAMLKKAEGNINFAKTTQISLVNCDAKNLPLKNSCVDKILCDMPFGKNFGTIEALKNEYPLLLQSMDRVLKPGGRCVLLTGEDLKPVLIKTVCLSSQQGFNAIITQFRQKFIALHTNFSSKMYDYFTVTSGEQSSFSQEEQRKSRTKFGWIPLVINYIKLGEMHAYICIFQKPND